MTSCQSTHILLEGLIKYRDNRKWKSRWAAVSKLSPVADCLQINLYRSCKDKFRNTPPRRVIQLQRYLGIESGFTLERESNTLAIICTEVTVVLCFDTREILHQWQCKLQGNFCKEQHYLVHIVALPPKSKLVCGPARLLLQDYAFCLVYGIPPRLLGHWPLEQLRRFGSVQGKFCFEAGSHCGKGTGLHVLYTNQGEEISKCFELASCGQLNSLNTQANDCHEYYHKNGQTMYKYANGTVANDKEVNKSNSSDSSLCDSCSHILNLSIGEENSRSDYYLNRSGIKCGLYHSSFELNSTCHERLCRAGTEKVSSVACHRRPDSICNANSHFKCQCRSWGCSSFGANTISRLSDINCDSAKCSNQECFGGPGSELSLPPNTSDSVKVSSPCSTTLGHCLIASDQESLFSQSSQGSSNSSSGCSSLVCTDHNRASKQHHVCLSMEGLRLDHARASHLMGVHLVHGTNHERNEPAASKEYAHTHDGCSRQSPATDSATQCEKWAHLYSQINFIKQNGQSDRMANYDIPRNLCVNAALLNQNKDPLPDINHRLCVVAQPNGHEPARDPNGDSFMQHSDIHRESESTLVRRHTKSHFLQPQSACVPDNESNQLSASTRYRQNEHHQLSVQPALRNTEHCIATQALEEPNYANMQFINSMALYENLCFSSTQDCSSHWSTGQLALSAQGDESISAAQAAQISQWQSRGQSSNQQSAECGGDCVGCRCDSDLCQCGMGRDADSCPAAHDELPGLHRNKTAQSTGSSISDTEQSMNEQSEARNHSVQPAERCASQSDSGKDKCAEGETQQNGNISPSGPRGDSRQGANNGRHYHAYDRKEGNISLWSSSSLHNRVRCKQQVGAGSKPEHQQDTAPMHTTKWSMANAIRPPHRQHHGSKSLLGSKSYSIDDITSTECFFKVSHSGHPFSPVRAGEWHCAVNGLALYRKHKSDQVLSAAKRSRTFTGEDQHRLGHHSWPDSDSESEDFCTSSQITVLCHSQTEST